MNVFFLKNVLENVECGVKLLFSILNHRTMISNDQVAWQVVYQLKKEWNKARLQQRRVGGRRLGS